MFVIRSVVKHLVVMQMVDLIFILSELINMTSLLLLVFCCCSYVEA